jgi:hypothetical protein
VQGQQSSSRWTRSLSARRVCSALIILAGYDATLEGTTPVTFNKQIAPIVFQHCSYCHRVNGAAPFSLLKYGDARKRAKEIQDVTSRRVMPLIDGRASKFPVAINTMGTKGNEMDAFSIAWIADYFDPFDFINVLLDGTNIQDKNNNNYSYWNNAKYNKLMKAASKLTGQARYTAYGNLDVDIMKNAAPWIPMFNYTSRDFIGPRVENFIYHPVYGHAVINALAIKK